MGSIEGKVALVTGAGSGIGEAIARRLDAEGARVAALDVDSTGAEITAGLLTRGMAVVADVADSAQVDEAVRSVVETYGRLDILVNNAGIRGGQEADEAFGRLATRLAETAAGTPSTALEATVNISDEAWHRMLGVHLDGTFYGTRAALRHMRAGSVIVNVSSVCGLTGCAHIPHYSAAKAGIEGFTRAVARDVAPQGIRVNCVAPGYIDTPLGDVMAPVVRQDLERQIALGRFGLPAEIASAVAFLVGPDGSYLTGQTLSPNGGFVME
ncbi:SDR family NAD(P)-dependent oxidoreductase [Saccharothrix algeriensis]|uniref:3-oxoacyl-[acyl-carrier protein] reductase n=1 Tax=Saccharothrix algeriensis TaxID=173560 RepID=A0ABS2SGD5_9PSEU|nr:SDR family NAD(P)-dependent oxidoreductase [Saccharothrix algeriensis]MBM7814328.1 3-oxoacyl-[acyl-carrier protein] reductase [Saccharothrix algeriensis]